MADLLTILSLDVSLIISMLILAYLNRKMGDALKIGPFYIILYCAALLVAVASGIDIAIKAYGIPLSPMVLLTGRCFAGVAAFGTCMRYWSWLFSEFFGV